MKPFIWSVFTGIVFLICPAHALEPANGRVILTISGQISETNDRDNANFDTAMLLSLPQGKITTGNPWVDTPTTYEGPLLQAILEAVGADGNMMKVTALNNYAVTVPISDAKEFGVIVAMKENGKKIRIRDKGPLFFIYPFDDRPELMNETMYGRSIWQIRLIEIY